MALTDSNGSGLSAADVAAVMGNSCNNGWGMNSDWWVILFLFAMMGNGFGGGFGWGGNDGTMPYFYNTQTQNDVNRGFADAGLANQLSGIQSAITSGFGDTALGIAGVNQNICQTGNGVVSAITGAQNALTQQMYSNQIADMERSFNAQTASTQGMNNIQSQLAQCCCDNRAATADVKYTIATEACANRATSTANTQAILDKLCQLELDGVKAQVEAKNDRIADLQNQLNIATMRESQVAQNAFISQGFANEVDQLYNRLKNCPVGTTPVYGNQPIFTCPNNGFTCGCGVA